MAALVLAVDDIWRRRRRRRQPGQTELSTACRRDLHGAWRLLTIFEAPERCILLLVAKHTRNANPCLLLYDALGIGESEVLRTKPTCCGPEGQPPIDPDLAARFEEGLRRLA